MKGKEMVQCESYHEKSFSLMQNRLSPRTQERKMAAGGAGAIWCLNGDPHQPPPRMILRFLSSSKSSFSYTEPRATERLRSSGMWIRDTECLDFVVFVMTRLMAE